ncbi:O-antigen ligase family protein [Pseudomonadales bacterium]|nr:O-antigen ligase family protein [Pseudomonadales bacterium]
MTQTQIENSAVLRGKDSVVRRFRQQKVAGNSWLSKILIFTYAPAICWFGYITSTLSLERLYLLILLFAFIIEALRNHLSLKITPAHQILFFWFGWATLTSLFAISPDLAITKLIACAIRIAAATIIFSMIIRHNAYSSLAWSFVVAGLGGGMFCFLFPSSATDFNGRFFGTVANANTFGVQITAGLACGLYLLSTVNKFKLVMTPLLIAIILFFVYLIIASGSRKAAVGMLLVVGLFGLSWSRQIAKKSILKAVLPIVAGVIAVIVIGFAVVQSSHGDRFVRIYEGFVLGKKDRIESSEQHRLHMYEKGWELAMENPVLGIGLDNFRLSSVGGLSGSFGTYAHSNYIELMVGTGMLGMGLYYLAWLIVAINGMGKKHRYRPEAQISMILLFIMCAYDFAGVSYYSKVSWVIYALILAGIYNLKTVKNTSQSKRK